MTQRENNERKQLYRCVLADCDLAQALRCVRLLRDDETLQAVPNEEARHTMRSALQVAMVIAYSRAWRAKDSGTTAGRLPKSVRSRLTREEKGIHEWLMRLRRKGFAHSDGDAAGVAYYYSHVPSSWNPFALFEPDTLAAIETMVERLLGEVIERRWELEPRVRGPF